MSFGSAVIVGGGVVGTAAAYYLAKAGWRVTVLDRGKHGAACSRGNCGYVCPSHVLPLAAPGAVWATMKTMMRANSPLKVRPSAVLANPGWFLGFARKCNRRDMLSAAVGIRELLVSSRALYDDLVRDEKLDCDWDPTGLLFVFHTPHEFQHYAAADELLTNTFATPAKKYDAEGLQHLEPALKPGSVSGGYLYEGDAQLRPDKLMAAWRKVIELAGGEFREDTAVTGFMSAGGTATGVTTAAGDIRADAVVVATGAWAPKMNSDLGCKLPIVPGKGYSLTTARPAVCPKYPMIFEEHRVAVSPFQSGYRVGSTMEFAGYDETLDRRRLKLLTDGAGIYLNDAGENLQAEEWWGWRPMVYDGKPVIDFSPTMKNVLVAAGHGMLGLSMATGTGKLAAEMLSGGTPHVDPSHYSLARFG